MVFSTQPNGTFTVIPATCTCRCSPIGLARHHRPTYTIRLAINTIASRIHFFSNVVTGCTVPFRTHPYTPERKRRDILRKSHKHHSQCGLSHSPPLDAHDKIESGSKSVVRQRRTSTSTRESRFRAPSLTSETSRKFPPEPRRKPPKVRTVSNLSGLPPRPGPASSPFKEVI